MEPWGKEIDTKSRACCGEFEDNFRPEGSFIKLEDSDEYLRILEKKLNAIRSKNNIVENLAAYRADCIARLLREGSEIEPVQGESEGKKLIED